MLEFKETYAERKKEINNFIKLMKFLESKEMTKSKEDDSISEFSRFFHKGTDEINGFDNDNKVSSIDFTYQELINILKSNVSLMIYNIIEFTVSGLMNCIYDEIKRNELSFIDVNESIRALWKKTILKAANDPNANFNTFLKKNDEIITKILNNATLDIDPRNTMPGGNLDGESIRDTFKLHGINMVINPENYRPNILRSIKEKRNELAHGAVSFIDAVRIDAISDIEENEKFVIAFLEELIVTVEDFIANEEYKYST